MHHLGIPTRDEIAALDRRIEEMTVRVGELPATPAAKATPAATTGPASASPERKPKTAASAGAARV